MNYHAATRFIPVASSGGVEVFAEAEGFVSLLNSPYYSHEHVAAIDLYPTRIGTEVYSPLDGVVTGKRVVSSPRPKHFHCSEREELLIVRPSQSEELIARVLHVDSSLGVGDRVEVGGLLGRLVRSGFFDFWTERHLHLEIRPLGNPFRAKGSMELMPILEGDTIVGEPCGRCPRLRVVRAVREYVLAEAFEGEVCMSPFEGFGCVVGGCVGILDAGLPHYGFGGVVLRRGAGVRVGDEVLLWGVEVGKVSTVYEGVAFFKAYPLGVEVNGCRIRGLSFYLWLRSPLVKLIPEVPGAEPLSVEEGAELRLALFRP